MLPVFPPGARQIPHRSPTSKMPSARAYFFIARIGIRAQNPCHMGGKPGAETSLKTTPAGGHRKRLLFRRRFLMFKQPLNSGTDINLHHAVHQFGIFLKDVWIWQDRFYRYLEISPPYSFLLTTPPRPPPCFHLEGGVW